MFPRSIIDGYDDSRSIIDNYRVMLQLVASFMIIIYDRHIFIAQATGWKYRNISHRFQNKIKISHRRQHLRRPPRRRSRRARRETTGGPATSLSAATSPASSASRTAPCVWPRSTSPWGRGGAGAVAEGLYFQAVSLNPWAGRSYHWEPWRS